MSKFAILEVSQACFDEVGARIKKSYTPHGDTEPAPGWEHYFTESGGVTVINLRGVALRAIPPLTLDALSLNAAEAASRVVQVEPAEFSRLLRDQVEAFQVPECSILGGRPDAEGKELQRDVTFEVSAFEDIDLATAMLVEELTESVACTTHLANENGGKLPEALGGDEVDMSACRGRFSYWCEITTCEHALLKSERLVKVVFTVKLYLVSQ